ncbi:MAG: hypothetical protein AAF250_10205 [Pseudomonadota bacterium]
MPNLSLFLASTFLASQPAVDQPAPQQVRSQETTEEGPDTIIVEAPPTKLERRRELRKMATKMIRRPRRQLPLGTFFMPICPEVSGVPADFARAMEDRMRRNAKDLGVRVRSSPDCRPNITVLFVPPEAGPPEKWLDYNSDMLRHLLSFQRMWVIDEKGPVRAWNVTALRDSDGAPQKRRAGVPTNTSTEVNIANQVRFVSRLAHNVTMEILGSFILIELGAANGKSVNQLADYATMRTFADTSSVPPGDAVAAQTIITLFQDEDAPEELTEFDRALISKLYSAPRNSLARRVYSNVAGRAVNLEEASNPQEN